MGFELGGSAPDEAPLEEQISAIIESDYRFEYLRIFHGHCEGAYFAKSGLIFGKKKRRGTSKNFAR